MTRSRIGICWYCDKKDNRLEWDHAPIPKSCGGKATVPTCVMCHRMKDMHMMENWPLAMSVTAAVELASFDLQDVRADGWPTGWDEFSQGARILWAKMVRVTLQRNHFTLTSA